MNKRIMPYIENIGEATTACLVTMVQGNVLALTLTHWVIASQTGIVAGAIASTALLLTRTNKRWLVAVVLGVVTAGVDLFIHPGMLGSAVTEAMVTGAGAAALSWLVGGLLRYWKAWRPTSAAN